MASKMSGKSCKLDEGYQLKPRGAYDLKNSRSFRVVKKLCNRGLVSGQFLNDFIEKFGKLKAIVSSKLRHDPDDEDYWTGKCKNWNFIQVNLHMQLSLRTNVT